MISSNKSMAQRIIAIDQSTSSTKALLFDEECRLLARTNVDHKQYYPQTGWVEHDAEEIYQNMIEAIRKLMAEVDLHYSLVPHTFSLAITNQRETAFGRILVVQSCAVSFGLTEKQKW